MNQAHKFRRILNREERWVMRENRRLASLRNEIARLRALLRIIEKGPIEKKKVTLQQLFSLERKGINREERLVSRAERRVHRFRKKLDRELNRIQDQLISEKETAVLQQLKEITKEIDANEGLFLRQVSYSEGALAKELAVEAPNWQRVHELSQQAQNNLNNLLAALEKLNSIKDLLAGAMNRKRKLHLAAREEILAEYQPSSYNHKIFYDAQEYYRSLLADIKQAQSLVCMEMYIFQPDAVGAAIASALMEKAREFREKNERLGSGAGEKYKVILILDGMGSPQIGARAELVNKMQGAGVEVNIFNPPAKSFIEYNAFSVLRHPLISFFGRDHRKLTVIDSKVAYFGGMNIGREYCYRRDTNMRISGLPALELAHSFFEMYLICKKYEIHSLTVLSKSRKQKREEYNRIHQESLKFGHPSVEGRGFKVIGNAPSFHHHEIRDEYIKLVRAASKSIYITNPYFIPGWKFIRELTNAAERGIDVKIILPKRSDHPLVDSAARTYFRKLLTSGVKIYLYNKRGVEMLHGKTMTIDGTYSTIGSSNLDYVSLSLNHEVNLFLADPGVAKDLDIQFSLDLKYCEEIISSSPNGPRESSAFSRIKQIIGYRLLGPLLRPPQPKYE